MADGARRHRGRALKGGASCHFLHWSYLLNVARWESASRVLYGSTANCKTLGREGRHVGDLSGNVKRFVVQLDHSAPGKPHAEWEAIYDRVADALAS